MQPDNIRANTEYQDTQDFVLVGRKWKTGHQQNQSSTETNTDRRHSQFKTSSSCQLNTEQTKGNSGAGESTQRKQREVFLVGDSILKNLQGRKMSSTAKVKISSFPGCTTLDMTDYIRPILWKKLDEIVLHVGTNSLRSSTSAREYAEEIVNLAHMISDESSAKLSISSLVSRADEEALGVKVSGVNKILRKLCNQNDWGYVDHSNISTEHDLN